MAKNPSNPLVELLQETHVFALVNRQRIIIGTKPKKILTTWDDVKKNFQDGWLLGYISYEQGHNFIEPPLNSPLQSKKTNDLQLPDVYFGLFDEVTIIENSPELFKAMSNLSIGKIKSNITKSEYHDKFQQIIKHLKTGDIYQVNLSQRFEANYTGNPLDIFSHFYASQPTDYAAYIQTPDFSIVSNSPELFLKISGKEVESRPMKGTALRSNDAETDNTNKQALTIGEKDKAELDMIIDIHRNDLYRTAKTGSVNVLKRRRITPYATVWQADAIVTSHIADKYNTLDVIEQSFPAGSITGAPKIRAMEIIHELETVRRNIYTGSIGFIDPTGNAELNVAIRTAIIKDDTLYYSSGGGIVLDSTEESEYQETLDKAKIIYNLAS
ncbi:MAG: aminodeoxychorismate synthase component I [bacterium]|nr:aminodeoxychorismate synthase component I [bacterium]